MKIQPISEKMFDWIESTRIMQKPRTNVIE